MVFIATLNFYYISFAILLTVTTHLQTDKSPYQYRGMFHALGTVYREEGFRALYRGWLPSVIGVVGYLKLCYPLLFAFIAVYLPLYALSYS